jgi:hypothetical protein
MEKEAFLHEKLSSPPALAVDVDDYQGHDFGNDICCLSDLAISPEVRVN